MSKNWNRHVPKLIEKHGMNCHYCGRLMIWDSGMNKTTLTVDHMHALSKGGTSKIDNLILACRECNLKKKAKHYQEFAMKRSVDAMLLFLMGGES